MYYIIILMQKISLSPATELYCQVDSLKEKELDSSFRSKMAMKVQEWPKQLCAVLNTNCNAHCNDKR